MKVSSTVTNAQGVPFIAVRLDPGDRYGLRSRLVATKPMIEFYDARPQNDTEWGQFISRYYLETLRNRKEQRAGLCLDGGVWAWQLTYENMAVISHELFND